MWAGCGTGTATRAPAATSESVDYSYSFDQELQQEWNWSERYAAQPEILAYLEHVADRFDLRRDIQFGTRVTDVSLDETTLRLAGRTERGERHRPVRRRGRRAACRMPTHRPDRGSRQLRRRGLLHTPAGRTRGSTSAGSGSGVIGTGSSGIQAIPVHRRAGRDADVFQRTANYSVPAGNTALDDADPSATRRPTTRAAPAVDGQRRRVAAPRAPEVRTGGRPSRSAAPPTRQRWQLGGVLFSKTFPDQLTDPAPTTPPASSAEEKIRADRRRPRAWPRLLIPTDHPIGTKRICTDTDYYRDLQPGERAAGGPARRHRSDRIDAGGLHTTESYFPLDTLCWLPVSTR